MRFVRKVFGARDALLAEALGARGVWRPRCQARDALEARGVLAKRLTRKVTGARCAWRSMHLAREALGARGVRRPRRLAREGARGVLARETLAAGGTWRGMCSAPDAFGARFAWRARHLARDALGEGEGEKYIYI